MKRWLYETGKKVATNVGVVKPPKESKFFEKGILTPKEFQLAGDQLVKSCPTWCWKPAAKGYHNKSFPKLKQYLYTKVPCRQRIKDVDIGQGNEQELEDGWYLISTQNKNNNSQQQQTQQQQQQKQVGNDFLSSDSSDAEEEEEEVKEDEIILVKQEKEKIVEQNEEVKEEDIQQEEEEKEEIVFKQEEEKEEIIIQQKQSKEAQEEEEKEEVYQQMKQQKQYKYDTQSKSRYYDLTITYDVYYFTPRMWLVGYKEDGTLLTEVQTLQNHFNLLQDEMFDDIMGDYQNKTVTLDPHPCLGSKQISIHPCKHASAMKHLIDMFLENGGQLKVHQAMFVFLKFISSVVPTIEYDFTVNMSFS